MNINDLENTVDGQILPELTGKVCWIGETRQAKFGPVQNIGVVDVRSTGKNDGSMVYFGVSNSYFFDESSKFKTFKFSSVAGSHGLQGVKRGTYNDKPQIKITSTCKVEMLDEASQDGGGASHSSGATAPQKPSSFKKTIDQTVELGAMQWLACLKVASATVRDQLGWPDLLMLDPTSPEFAMLSHVVCPLATHLRLNNKGIPRFDDPILNAMANGTVDTQAEEGSDDDDYEPFPG